MSLELPNTGRFTDLPDGPRRVMQHIFAKEAFVMAHGGGTIEEMFHALVGLYQDGMIKIEVNKTDVGFSYRILCTAGGEALALTLAALEKAKAPREIQ